MRGYDSAGVLMPRAAWRASLAMIGVTLGATALLATVVTPQGILALIRWLGPLWVVLGRILSFIDALFAVLAPILEWLFERLVEHLSQFVAAGPRWTTSYKRCRRPAWMLGNNNYTADPIPPWIWVAARYTLVLVVFVIIIFVLLMLGHVRRITRYRSD